ncbi:hypothetical protein F1559_002497 [Cyanidiococcus yangmingshanensis]|uniref:Uncharacterized protein n=1 Tax=Cyanidiococcus yangmingshanensis TaxID=2690220 RepID=A0A7J7INX4_9RHOD|nr:hypothetical protein F1559_002497 [Cyanidiococcus yangmingshanensis]
MRRLDRYSGSKVSDIKNVVAANKHIAKEDACAFRLFFLGISQLEVEIRVKRLEHSVVLQIPLEAHTDSGAYKPCQQGRWRKRTREVVGFHEHAWAQRLYKAANSCGTHTPSLSRSHDLSSDARLRSSSGER